MVLDPEGIARTTRWPNELQLKTGAPDYPGIIDAHAGDPERVADILKEHLLKLTDLRDDLIENGAPESMISAPGVNLTLAETILVELDELHEKGPAPR
jgi:serine/threonine-protein kinase HipA